MKLLVLDSRLTKHVISPRDWQTGYMAVGSCKYRACEYQQHTLAAVALPLTLLLLLLLLLAQDLESK